MVSTHLTGEKSPAAFMDEMANGLTSLTAAARGITMRPVKRITISGFAAATTVGTEKTSQGTFKKAVVVVATDDDVTMLTGSLEESDPLTAEDLLAVLTNARWSDTVAPGDLGYDLTPAPGYQRTETAAHELVLTLGTSSGRTCRSCSWRPRSGR